MLFFSDNVIKYKHCLVFMHTFFPPVRIKSSYAGKPQYHDPVRLPFGLPASNRRFGFRTHSRCFQRPSFLDSLPRRNSYFMAARVPIRIGGTFRRRVSAESFLDHPGQGVCRSLHAQYAAVDHNVHMAIVAGQVFRVSHVIQVPCLIHVGQ